MAEEQKDYLVRGALLMCDKGSHPRRLNLPQSHGIYLVEHAMIHKDDGKIDDNISYFGVCSASKPPKGAQTIRLAGYVREDGEAMPDVQGPKCSPAILKKWQDVELDGVTMNSCLICSCGGIITPKTSGQEYKD